MLDNTSKASIKLLTEIRNALSGGLGFGPAPYPVRVYCNRTHSGCNWYTVEDGQPQPIPYPALTGKLQSIRFENVERRGRETSKILIEIDADRTYILEAGSLSQFSRTFLNCCAQFGAHELHNRLVTLVPSPGTTDDSVLFCRLWVDGKPIRAEGIPASEDSNAWRAIARKAIEAVRPF